MLYLNVHYVSYPQVAGHLFEEGKAGSLVDDRGHFYKPIQPGPRGDREKAFYQAIQSAVAADRVSEAIRAQQREAQSNLAATGSAAAQATGNDGATTPAVSVPWMDRRLSSHSFPSFKNSYREVRQRDPMRVLQTDELGLISEAKVEEWLDLGEVSEEDDVDEDGQWYGRSPDSDEGGVLTTTGDHVMEGITSAHLEAQGRLGKAGESPCSPLVTKRNVEQHLRNQSSRRSRSASPGAARDHSSSLQPIPETSSSSPGRDNSSSTSAQQQRKQQQQQFSQNRPEKLTEAENDQATALLGQPTFGWDVEGQDSYIHTEKGAHHVQFHTSHRVTATGNGGLSEALRRLSIEEDAAAAIRATPSTAPNAVVPSCDSDQQEVQKEAEAYDLNTVQQQAGIGTSDTSMLLQGTVAASALGSSSAGKTPRSPPQAALEEFDKLPFALRNAPLLRVLPKFYGVRQGDGRTLLELEDLARSYSHPCIMDIKIGYRTWYSQAEPAYIERCRKKDASTTQASLGFKICGMQVYRHGQGGYWRASKRWCKTLPEVLVDKALLSFVHNERGLRPSDVYGGPSGAVAQLDALAAWFQLQHEFHFYSASVLIMYEGDASDAESAAVKVKLVDFAHTFRTDDRGKDDNFLSGLISLAARLSGVARLEAADTLL